MIFGVFFFLPDMIEEKKISKSSLLRGLLPGIRWYSKLGPASTPRLDPRKIKAERGGGEGGAHFWRRGAGYGGV